MINSATSAFVRATVITSIGTATFIAIAIVVGGEAAFLIPILSRLLSSSGPAVPGERLLKSIPESAETVPVPIHRRVPELISKNV